MTDDERAAAFLREHAGLFFCAACISIELHAPTDLGRSLVWKLQALPGYEMRGGRCASCSRVSRVIRHVGTADVVGTTAEVVAFLLDNKGIYLCHPCVAFAVEKSLSEVKDAVASLEGLEEFDRLESGCAVCGRHTTVSAALDVSAGETGGKDDLTVRMLTGTVQYRGWRLDLLSYQIRSGWRPFVLIKGRTNVRVPDTPSLLSSTLPSKGAANDHALKAAMAWIDKRSTD